MVRILQIKKKSLLFGFIGCVSIMGLMGCQPQNAQPEDTKVHSEHTGDLQETTNSATILPSFVKKVDPQIGHIYQLAAQNSQLLEYMPCYCGCGESAGHKNNLDCFVNEIKENGQVTWDSHGTKCGTCLEIAAESVALQKQGKSTKEIRNYIDNKYKEDYAKPTPTPMPS